MFVFALAFVCLLWVGEAEGGEVVRGVRGRGCCEASGGGACRRTRAGATITCNNYPAG